MQFIKNKRHIIHISFYFFLLLFIIAFLFGMFSNFSSAEGKTSLAQELNISHEHLIDILKNNLLLGFLLLIGFFSFNILNVVVIFYNGIVLGIYYAKFIEKLGTGKTLVLLLPHGILELVTLLLISQFSVKLTFELYTFMQSKLDDTTFIRMLFSFKSLLLFLLLTVAGLIEVYITPLLYNSIY